MPSNKLRERFTEIAEQARIEQYEKGYWLQQNIHYDDCYQFNDKFSLSKIKLLLDAILCSKLCKSRKIDNKLLDLNIFCANLFRCDVYKPLSISLNRSNYSNKCTRYSLSSYFTIEIYHYLLSNGWIKNKPGFNSNDNKGKSRYTRIWPTDKFLRYFDISYQPKFSPVSLVILRDIKRKDTQYIDTKYTYKIKNILAIANQVNAKHSVIYSNRNISYKLNTDLYAIYHNNSFEQGGRLYNRDGYQKLSEERRQKIKIDGQPTVELDYSALHPRLLYTMVNIQYPLDEDPYTCICADLQIIRPFIKILMLALIHSQSERKAISSGNWELMRELEFRQVLKDNKIKVTELVDRFKKAHNEIEHLFCSQIGLKLMNLDSKIALEIVRYFTTRDIPILAIHDSFIVQEHLRDELKRVMTRAYRKLTGFDCPIK